MEGVQKKNISSIPKRTIKKSVSTNIGFQKKKILLIININKLYIFKKH